MQKFQKLHFLAGNLDDQNLVESSRCDGWMSMQNNVANKNDSNDSIVSETGVKFSSHMLDDEDFPQPPIHRDFGNPRQAMISTLNDVSLSLFDTGADGNLRMNRN